MKDYKIDWMKKEVNEHDIKMLRKRKTMNFLLTAIMEDSQDL